jgi:hypothetical protein
LTASERRAAGDVRRENLLDLGTKRGGTAGFVQLAVAGPVLPHWRGRMPQAA